MRNKLCAVSVLALAVAVAPACATKKFVRGEVGNVNTKVDTLSGSLEETQERTRKNEERIGAVDQKAEAAGQSAQDARGAADAACGVRARKVNGRVDQVVTEVAATNAAWRRRASCVFEVTLSEDQGNFKSGKTDLPDEAKARLDEVVGQLKADTEERVHRDRGPHRQRRRSRVQPALGLERAEAVKRYLYEQHQVPLHKMNVISYGEDKPVAPNNNRDGRAQNRRVVVKVLS